MTSISLATLARRAADLGNPLPCSDDTQLWFSEHPADLELAKAMCETCPLRRACLAGALGLPLEEIVQACAEPSEALSA